MFGNEKDAENFFEFFNCLHKNIKYTLEKESNKFLPFLDILIKNKGNRFQHQFIERKHQLGCLHSFTPSCYKIGFVSCLIHRAFKLVVHTLYFMMNWKRFNTEKYAP